MSAHESDELDLLDIAVALAEWWKAFLIVPLAAAAIGYVIGFAMPVSYTATLRLPPSERGYPGTCFPCGLWRTRSAYFLRPQQQHHHYHAAEAYAEVVKWSSATTSRKGGSPVKFALIGGIASVIILGLLALISAAIKASIESPNGAAKLARIKTALRVA